jgi:hypothetical protein
LTVITSPVFALQSPDDLEPLKNYAAIARANNAAMEAALVQRATPAGLPDLNAEIAARAALAAQWQTKPVTQVRASAALALTGNWTLLSFGTVELDEYAAPDTSMWAAATPNRLSAADRRQRQRLAGAGPRRMHQHHRARRGAAGAPETAAIFADLAARYHATVEPLVWPGCWGYALRPIKGTNTYSNHSSGTAIDLNAPAHPQGVAAGQDVQF